ncbi:glycoside hydrolase family 2 [Niveispirillum lacus]|uniref:Glycoside hydrolase family 2 n=1 Tax=Niveispirillum lacus TaxID=1981099 RepID=A0A255YYF0_9PROT|nr:glycoside hydrolase family 2 TIM barrel-domain containing protein [Niveispirillum lacus]OYQ34267.1 glycoside hydrolase family 2 [Niveispirillum lacus]
MKRHLLATAIALSFALGAHAQAPANGSEPRITMQLKGGWRFHLGEAPSAEKVDFPDGNWAPVTVPHTWNRVGYYTTPSPDRVNTPDTINKTQGTGWYRLSFTPSGDFKGKRAWLQFDAVSRRAEVWLNGQYLGRHEGGFSRFRLDATAALKPGAANLLVVKADNSKPAPGSTTADILPLAGDFFVHGGIYRNVALIATSDIHADMLDHGGPGIYATTKTVDGNSAQVQVAIHARNSSSRKNKVTIVTRLVDATGRTVAEGTQSANLPPGETVKMEQPLSVTHARLWQGTTDPYLHDLVVEFQDGRGQVLDRVTQKFGIREVRVDATQGLILNGKPVRLHGVGLHQDLEGKGWAMDETDIAKDVEIIREMGANTIRLTHYQHGPTIHELADKHGLILWDEIPLVSAWTPPGKMVATEGLIANARRQLQELIKQNQNHAAVVTWGIANEVDFGSTPVAPFIGITSGSDPAPLLRELRALSTAIDPSRPTVLATCCEGGMFGDAQIPIVATEADLGGANRYFGWYYGKPSQLGANIETLRAARPSQPLAITEYGAGGAVTIHTDDPLGGPVDARGRDQPEEYLSYFHEESWAILGARTDLWATWLWNAFDFATLVRKEGDAQDINTKGLVTYDRKVKKDAFFFYKANWNPAPTVHITGRRYVNRAYPVTHIRVYSNAPATELQLNGRGLGVRRDCPQKICVWEDVLLDQGDNAVAAVGLFADGPVRDSVNWTLDAGSARAFRIDSGALVAAPSEHGRFGSDAFFTGGTAGSVQPASGYGPPRPRKVVNGTADTMLISTYREGDFTYRLPMADGTYRVTLSFLEPTAAPGERQFDVLANGEKKLRSLDVAALAGAPMTMVSRNFEVKVTGGKLVLHFTPVKGKAIVSAIAVEAI